MRKFIIVLSLIGFTMLTACTTNRFAYPNGANKFTVLASSGSPQTSDNEAYAKAVSVCNKTNATVNVLHVDRAPNSVAQINLNGQIVYITPAYQKQDFMTIMQVACVPKPQSK